MSLHTQKLYPRDSVILPSTAAVNPVSLVPDSAKPTRLRSFLTSEVTWVMATAALIALTSGLTVGSEGLIGNQVKEWGALFWIGAWCALAHFTIVSMSLSFHRMHTHKGATLHPAVDGAFQIWLWLTTSMSKLDWVAVHIYHHAHSDTEKDPHSPNQKGFWRVFLLGALDYTRAKSSPEVKRLHRQIPESRFENFLRKTVLWGPLLTFLVLAFAFGPLVGAISAISVYLISPFLAVGGVNTLAHTFGYRTYATKDNSRNIGYLFPLNFLICGELDHNNHHAHPKSCSFRHRWYEFDIGYAYLKIMEATGLATLHHEAPVKARARTSEKATA